jgi:hypothetical protein
LHFLTKNRIPAKLLFIYFYGDKNPEKEESCPKSQEDWRDALEKQQEAISLNPVKDKAIGIIDLFLNVVPSQE